ncbi:hypothetical protein GSI_03286 [Ganoderma sinense ZZ0214-1]|uniref:Ricin B lectin domain-containing protein n=1 Tax=Ganoderma sinense ZZ0214-1 TaxID=1077348 RepID=A0A2G8SL79_9APHY|nr:hypothetical protein GSI_03286 [Ganoderma sinense ZZ0214-1]
MFEHGRTYKLVNAKAGNVLDLSGSDNRSLIGYGWHGGHNQQWHLHHEDGGWVLRNRETGRYLGIEGEARDGTPVIAVEEPFRWHIVADEEDTSTFRLFVPNTHYNLDLSDHGNPTPGTPVTLWGKWHPGKNQTWRFEEDTCQMVLCKQNQQLYRDLYEEEITTYLCTIIFDRPEY